MNSKFLIQGLVYFQFYLMLDVLPLWAIYLNAIVLGVSTLLLFDFIPKLPHWIINVLALGCVGFGLYEFKSFWTIDSADYFILTLMSLRSLRIENLWQKRFMIYSTIIILMSYLVVNQDFKALTFMFLGVGLILVAIFSFEYTTPIKFKSTLRQAFRALLYSIPFWIVLFFIFPRFNLSFLNFKISQASVGFSENFNPGQISKIVQSKEIAFQAEIKSPKSLPQRQDLYWRVLYYYDFDGFHWKPPVLPVRKSIVKNEQKLLASDYIQKFTLGTSSGGWIMSLGYPDYVEILNEKSKNKKNPQVNNLGNHIFKLSENYSGRMTFEVYSSEEDVVKENLIQYLRVPEALNPDIHELANKLQNSQKNLTQKIQSIMTYFDQEKFKYTLEPGEYGEDGLSVFLFKRKLGFCEHFAAAFATLMRLMDVPSRVVVGYQGGEYNQVGRFWLVSQQDAHAWTEVYDYELKKWRRVDPTQWIEPLRISLGGAYNQLSEEELAEKRQGRSSSDMKSFLSELQTEFQLRINHIKDFWENFILNYNLEYQMNLWREILEELKKEKVPSAIVLIILIYLSYKIFIFWRPHWTPRDEYREVFKKLEEYVYKKYGINRILGETEKEYLDKVLDMKRNALIQNSLPQEDFIEAAQAFWQVYCSCRYAEEKSDFLLIENYKKFLRSMAEKLPS
ncbi:MAG TPA: DUF3488 and transglutaminase-like domain-containing protein [Pseudobdellovibrionaceae bacterium]|nr:DUF3488 and transglutaminase-like domain-containing protein [Pseudobdellovibrionaceae bacterium]